MVKKDFIQDALSAAKTKNIDKAREPLKKQLVELSDSNDYANAVNEWVFDSYKYCKGKCACGNTIWHNYTVRNKINGNRMTIGSTCMPKYFIGRDDLAFIIKGVSYTQVQYENILKKYGKLVNNQYIWNDECKIVITEYDKKHRYYSRDFDTTDLFEFGSYIVWDIPDDFWRIIRILMSFDEKHEVFDAYEVRFLNDILWQSYAFVDKTEKQQNFFIKIFNEKVMPILYDWYGPVDNK